MKLPRYWNRVWINWAFALLLFLVVLDVDSQASGGVIGIAIGLLFLNGILWGELK